MKVGARERVWWLPVELRGDGDPSDSAASAPDYARLLAQELQYHAVFTETFDAIAGSMGIAASTWLRHLRLAEQKLVQWYFDEFHA